MLLPYSKRSLGEVNFIFIAQALVNYEQSCLIKLEKTTDEKKEQLLNNLSHES